MRNFVYLVLMGAGLLTLALVVRSGIFARKNPGEPVSAAMRAALAETRPEIPEDDARRIRAEFPTASTLPSGLMYIDGFPGTGKQRPRIGDTVTANYTGRLLDGTIFDSSASHGGPIKFRVGVGDVIKGWDEAFLTMRKGEKRTLIIPYWLGYSGNNRPSTVPYQATVVFEVELVDFH
ncbi:MAG TPA: FKBP-type peptidyl-prolyl cis-trans isomerase [Opitutaceae bacterium]|jgi:FKBP-type peptidyl-prolyl cis-trans isomerase